MPGWKERLRRSEHPWMLGLKRARRRALRMDMPVPRMLHPVLRGIESCWRLAGWGVSSTLTFAWRKPLFRAHCATAGRGLRLDFVPRVVGRPRIVVGDDVTFSGPIMITATGPEASQEIVFSDHCWVGHMTSFQVAGRIEIGERAAIAAYCYIADNDAHARAFGARLSGAPPSPEEIAPVRIGRAAWIGRGSMILKGVTIGDGAIVGAGSVVTSDVPAFCVALGNPARIVRRERDPFGGTEADRALAKELGLEPV